MREREIKNAINVLKTAIETSSDGDGKPQDAVVQISAVLSEDILKQVVGPLFLSAETPGADAEVKVARMLDTVSFEDDEAEVRLLIECGEMLYIQGNWINALQYFEQALARSEETGYDAGKARALRQIGRMKRRRGEWHESRSALEQAIELYRTLQDQTGEAEALLNLGNICFEHGGYEEAEKIFEQALVISEHLDADQIVGDITLSLGVIKQVLGFSDEALTHFTESLAHYELLGDRRRIGQACFNLGIVHAELRSWGQAGMMYERALDIARQNKDMGMVGLIYLRRGEMQVTLSDVSMALGYGQQAMAIFDQLHDPLGRADVYKLYGRIAGLKRAWQEAEAFLKESTRLHRRYESPLNQAEVEEAWGWLYDLRGNRNQALEAYKRAMAQFHALGAMSNVNRVRDACMKLMGM